MTQTLFEAYNDCKRQLAAIGIEDYGFESRQIIRQITGLSNEQIMMKYNSWLTPVQQRNLTEIIRQRQARYPLQYILREWSFYGCEFSVGPGVLIPRADTETAVDVALEFLKDHPDGSVLDLCAGSGCIGIVLAAQCQNAQVTLLEKYAPAIEYLKKNVERNGVGDRATVIEGDIFSADAADAKYDLIVSNPPYVAADEMESVSPEVKYEPETALYGGEDGLMFYRAITANYRSALNEGGMLCFEVGENQADSVRQILAENGFCEIGTRADLNNAQRVVFGTLKSVE